MLCGKLVTPTFQHPFTTPEDSTLFYFTSFTITLLLFFYFNIILINDPKVVEQIFKPEKYDLVLIGFRMSLMDGFDLYNKLYEMSKKLQQDTSPSNDFRVCFMTASRINYTMLAEIHPEFGEECYVCKEVPKDVFIKH